MSPSSDPIEAWRRIELDAAARVADKLQSQSTSEVASQARIYEVQYKTLLDEAFLQDGRISYDFFCEMLQRAYPNVEEEMITDMAAELVDRIRSSFGPTKQIPQEEFFAADAHREAAINELAARLTPDELKNLEQQACRVIGIDKFPENYEDWRAHYLAEWVSKGRLDLAG